MQCPARLPWPTSTVHPILLPAAAVSPVLAWLCCMAQEEQGCARCTSALLYLPCFHQGDGISGEGPACAPPSGAWGRYHLCSVIYCCDTADVSEPAGRERSLLLLGKAWLAKKHVQSSGCSPVPEIHGRDVLLNQVFCLIVSMGLLLISMSNVTASFHGRL